MTIYSSYTYNAGGFGDFIRSLLAVFVYCKLNNIEHKLFIPNHPLNTCFENCLTVLPEKHNNNNQQIIIKPFITTHSWLMLRELEICKNHNPNYSIIIISNNFDFIDPYTLKKYTSEFKDYFKFSKQVFSRVTNLYNLENIKDKEYVSIQIRCGDKFMECSSQCIYDDIRVDPNNQELFDKLERSIKYLKTIFGPNILICLFTDVQSLKEKICKEYGLIGFKTEIQHTASISNNNNSYIDTVAEFELLGRSSTIIFFSNTGFAYWSAFINNVPLLICTETDIVPFESLRY
jgi:hypothetical protein